MSILINMEMPTSCRACHLKMNCEDCEGLECVCVPLHQQIGYLDDLLTDKRRDDCPLVPVPPHGRLIDADDLTGKMEHNLWTIEDKAESELGFDEAFRRGMQYGHAVCVDAVNDAPTIIPAEEGET